MNDAREQIFDVAQLAHVEMLTPDLDGTMRFFTEFLSLQETARTADPVRRITLARDLTEGKGTPAEERNRLAIRLRSLGSLLRDVRIIAMHADRAMLANADLEAQLETLSSSFDARRSQRAYAAVDRALAALDRNASPKVVADWLLLEL